MYGLRLQQLARWMAIWLLTQFAAASTDVEHCSHAEASQGASQLQRATRTEPRSELQFGTSRTRQFPPGWPNDAATSSNDAFAGDVGSSADMKEPFVPWESGPPANAQSVMLDGELERNNAASSAQHQEMGQDAMLMHRQDPLETSLDRSGQPSTTAVEDMRRSQGVHSAQGEPGSAMSVLHQEHTAAATETQQDMARDATVLDQHAQRTTPESPTELAAGPDAANSETSSQRVDDAQKPETVKDPPHVATASETQENAAIMLDQPAEHANPGSAAEPPTGSDASHLEKSSPAKAPGNPPAEAEAETAAEGAEEPATGHADPENHGEASAAAEGAEEPATGHADPENHGESSASEVEPEAASSHKSAEGHGPATHGHGEPLNAEERVEEELKEEISLAVGVMLLGMVAFVMSIFYLVNFDDEDIRFATWNALSSCISIFCAILIFTVMKHLMMYYFGEGEGMHHAPPDWTTLSLSFIRLTVIVGLWYFMLASLRGGHVAHQSESKKDYTMKAGGVLGAHVVAFVAIDSFGNIQQLSFFRGAPVMCFVSVAIASSAMGGFVTTFKYFRSKLNDASWHEFQEECDEGEQEAMSLTFGFLLSQFFRFCIVGHLAPLHGSPKGKTQIECFKLLFVATVFACMTVALSKAVQRAARAGKRESLHQFELLQDIVMMTMAWCVLSYGQWQFWTATGGEGIGEGTVMTARVIMALASSAICFTFIFIIDKVADAYPDDEQDEGGFADGCRKLLTAFVLSMALSWEAAFDRAVEGLSEQFEGSTKVKMEALISIGLCAVVLPAWKMYILPNSIKKTEHA